MRHLRLNRLLYLVAGARLARLRGDERLSALLSPCVGVGKKGVGKEVYCMLNANVICKKNEEDWVSRLILDEVVSTYYYLPLN